MRLVFGSILVVGGLIAVTVLTRLLAQGDQEKRLALGFSGLRLIAMALIPVGALMILSSGVRMISAGQVGVAVLFGKVQPVVLHEGINLVNPLYDVVEMVLNYRLLPDKAAEVYQRIGPNFASVIIDPAAQEVLKANTALHVATEILHQRPKIKADIQGELTTWLAKYGIEVKEAALANISFDKAYEKAIEAKQIEEQKAEQKRYELVQAQRQAEIAAAQAKGQGDAAREKAKGEGEATRIRADAEATYNQKVSASLTPTLIQQRYLEKWDGKLPQFSMGSGANAPGLMLNMPMPAPAKP